MRGSSLALAAAGALFSLSLAAPALAAGDVKVTDVGIVGSLVSVNVSGGPPPVGSPVFAAVINLKGVYNPPATGSFDFDAFCVDLLHTINTGTGQNLQYDFGTHLDLTPPISGAQNVKVRKLAGLYFSDPTLGGHSGAALNNRRAALQVAIWSVIYPALSFSANPTVDALVTTYLAGLPTYSVDWGARYLINVDRNKRQDFIVPGVVPEPATWAMLITGFGLVGLGLRRRQRSLASVAA